MTTLNLTDNEFFNSVFEFSPIGMALVGVDGTWLKTNDAVSRIAGYPKEELLQITFQDITHPDDLQKDLNKMTELLDGKIDRYEMEKRYFHKHGQIVWIQLTVTLVHNEDGQPRFFISQIQDISEQKKLEFDLHLRRKTLKAILENTQSIIIRMNKDFEILFINSAVKSFAGIDPAKIKGRKLSDFPDVFYNYQIHHKAVREIFATQTERFVEFERTSNGKTIYYMTHLTPEFNEKGQLVSALGVIFNVTENREIEKELRKVLSEIKQLRDILPICSYCQKIRDDKDYWHSVENYISTQTNSTASRNLCPDCEKK